MVRYATLSQTALMKSESKVFRMKLVCSTTDCSGIVLEGCRVSNVLQGGGQESDWEGKLVEETTEPHFREGSLPTNAPYGVGRIQPPLSVSTFPPHTQQPSVLRLWYPSKVVPQIWTSLGLPIKLDVFPMT